MRDAFSKRGHDATSCDFLDTERKGQHIKGDVVPHLTDGWDLMIAHPPCTYLCVSGAKHFSKPGRKEMQERALNFVKTLFSAPIPKIALENPVGIISTQIRKPDQIIQPWQFGHGEMKTTCLWLKNLPLLKPTDIVSGRGRRMWRMPPGPSRWRDKSRTYLGIADAMAEQWGRTYG